MWKDVVNAALIQKMMHWLYFIVLYDIKTALCIEKNETWLKVSCSLLLLLLRCVWVGYKHRRDFRAGRQQSNVIIPANLR